MGSESLIFFGFIHARAMHYFVCVCLKWALFVFERDGALAIDIFKPPKVSARKREKLLPMRVYTQTHVQISISNQLQKWESSRMRKNQFRTLSRSLGAVACARKSDLGRNFTRGCAFYSDRESNSCFRSVIPPRVMMPAAARSQQLVYFSSSSPLDVLPSYLFTLIARPEESALEFASWLTQSNLHKQTWPVFSHYGAA